MFIKWPQTSLKGGIMADLEMPHCQNSNRTTLNVLVNPHNQNIDLLKNTISVEETSKGAHSTKKGLVEDSELFIKLLPNTL